MSRPHSMGVLLVALIAVMASHCNQLDDDPVAAQTEFAGPEATDCGYADGGAYDGLRPETVRACMLVELQAGRAFRGLISPASDDGGTISGWASDGQNYLRIREDYITGCAPVWEDEMATRDCAEIRDRGEDCGRMWDDLCFECVPL